MTVAAVTEVADEAASVVMARFHRLCATGLGAAAALREVRLSLTEPMEQTTAGCFQSFEGRRVGRPGALAGVA